MALHLNVQDDGDNDDDYTWCNWHGFNLHLVVICVHMLFHTALKHLSIETGGFGIICPKFIDVYACQ